MIPRPVDDLSQRVNDCTVFFFFDWYSRCYNLQNGAHTKNGCRNQQAPFSATIIPKRIPKYSTEETPENIDKYCWYRCFQYAYPAWYKETVLAEMRPNWWVVALSRPNSTWKLWSDREVPMKAESYLSISINTNPEDAFLHIPNHDSCKCWHHRCKVDSPIVHLRWRRAVFNSGKSPHDRRVTE